MKRCEGVEVDVHRRFIADTGWSISLIEPGDSRSIVSATSVSPVGITGDELPIKGEEVIEFSLGVGNFVAGLAYVPY
jgi:hypothetical protein